MIKARQVTMPNTVPCPYNLLYANTWSATHVINTIGEVKKTPMRILEFRRMSSFECHRRNVAL